MHCKEPVRHYVKSFAVSESDAPLPASGAFIFIIGKFDIRGTLDEKSPHEGGHSKTDGG